MALDNIDYPVCWVTSKGVIEKCNEAFHEFIGYTDDLLQDFSFFDFDENMSKKKWKNLWTNLEESKSFVLETAFNKELERDISVELNFTLIESKDVQLACVFIRDSSVDNALRIQIEETKSLRVKNNEARANGSKSELDALRDKQDAIQQLQDLQRQHESILQSAGDGIYGLDCNGHTIFANATAIKMVGWKLEEMVGKNQHDLIHHTNADGSSFDKLDCSIYAAFHDGKIHTVESEIFWRKDGTCFPVEYKSTPIHDENGILTGAVVSFRDITRRKEAEKALSGSNEELKKALAEVKKLKSKVEQENLYLQQEIKLTHNFEEIISQSRKFKAVLKQVEQGAKTDATILILGESGTGKELIARAVHNISKRKGRPMVKVNCAALPATLIESELFGHEKGAFTGAIARKIGRFELADGGTIFLDEIGELPIELQSKLLRVLQEGEYERLGNPQTFKVNVRVIAATNVNLFGAIAKGTFREDLYYRLNVFPIEIPALRERKEDIPLLTRHFLLKYNAHFGKNVELITQGVIDALTQYNWPGNIRELENVIERAVIISPDRKLEIGDAIPKVSLREEAKDIITLADNERAHILKTLKLTNWRISGDRGAAKILDINRTTLEARMKKLGIDRP